MSAALNSLFSRKGIFNAECEYFRHLVSNSKENGYLALYQIVRTTHPVRGQATTQPSHPSQKKTQSFYETCSIHYFQSEACSGHTYTLSEEVILVFSRLHPLWCDTMKHRYTHLVPQNGLAMPIPLE
jgi:hypothetical protein